MIPASWQQQVGIFHIGDTIMKALFFSLILMCCLGGQCLLAEIKPMPPVKIVLLGDSTVQNYSLPNERRGWGQVIGEYLTDNVTIVNLAAGGRSTKTFISEGRLDNALAENADYAMIQFGHNDSHAKENPESTDPNGDYRDYLKQYIQAFNDKGVKMLFVTPMHRRIFRKDGSMATILLPYRNAMLAITTEYKQPVVDLYQLSEDLFLHVGPEKSEYLSCNDKDRSHFSPKGAQAMALLILQDMLKQNHPLAAYIKPDVAAMLRKTPAVELAPKPED
jgi:lysophospholipase L1-like esterase